MLVAVLHFSVTEGFLVRIILCRGLGVLSERSIPRGEQVTDFSFLGLEIFLACSFASTSQGTRSTTFTPGALQRLNLVGVIRE